MHCHANYYGVGSLRSKHSQHKPRLSLTQYVIPLIGESYWMWAFEWLNTKYKSRSLLNTKYEIPNAIM